MPNVIAPSALVSAQAKGHKGSQHPEVTPWDADSGRAHNVIAYSALVSARGKGQKGPWRSHLANPGECGYLQHHPPVRV